MVNDKKITKEWNLETKARRFRQNTSAKISRENAHKCHFDHNSEANEITLYDLEENECPYQINIAIMDRINNSL